MEDIICYRCDLKNDFHIVESGPHLKAVCNNCDRYIKFISKSILNNKKTSIMAAGQSSNAIFCGITNGQIVRQFQNKTDKSVERVNKNGKTVHEEFYSWLSGYITNITVKEHEEYGKFWVVILKDEDTGELQNLQFNYSSGYANGFLKALPNIDLSKPVKISASAKKEGDKTKTTIFINQDGTAAKWHYTKDNPNGLPQLKKIKVKGKDTWDDTDVMEFLENMVNTEILPNLGKTTPVEVESEEDLPF